MKETAMVNFLFKYKKIVLLLGDIFILYLSLWFVVKWRYSTGLEGEILRAHLTPFTIIFLMWIVFFYLFGFYDPKTLKQPLFFLNLFFKSLVVNALVGITFFYLFPSYGVTPKTNLLLTIVLSASILFLWRRIYDMSTRRLVYSGVNILLIGNSSQFDELKENIEHNHYLGYKVVKHVNKKNIMIDELNEIVREGKVNLIVVANDLLQDIRVKKVLFDYLRYANIRDLAGFYEEIMKKVPLDEIDEVWFLQRLREEDKLLYQKAKRLLDIIVSLLIGIVTVIVFPFVFLAIMIEDRGSIFYKQKRMGQNGRIFEIIKFRSMGKSAEKLGALWAKKGDVRVTRVGSFLRKTSIDELPQFWNILKGDMSVVGPRPERPEFLHNLVDEISFYQAREIIKPGLTGWAQINYPYGASIEDAKEKLQYELYYIKNRCLSLDIRVILKTIGLYFKGERGKLAH